MQTRENGSEGVRARVLWGAHEQVRGVRDFSKASRLRLERFLGLAHSQGLSVELELGFPPSKDTFPAWTRTLEHTSTVPAIFWENGHESFCHTTIPSLFDSEITEGFESFVEEVMGLCHLYQQPEGPISRVWLDLGVFHADSQIIEHAGFAEFMRERYRDIAALNVVFQTSFKSFDSLSTKASFRTLLDRRAWVAAHDFKRCRESMLKRVTERLSRKFPELSPVTPSRASTGAHPFEIFVDSTFLEVTTDGQRCFPCLPAGIVNPIAVQSFRVADYLSANARREGVRIHYSQNFRAEEAGQKRLIVVCGKYLARDAMTALEAFTATGGTLYFPFGAPLYDESLSAWKIAIDRNRVAAGTIAYDENAWDEMVKGVSA